MAVRFARALEVSTDDLLQSKKAARHRPLQPSRKVLRRLERIETLPARHQQAVLKSIDMMLTGLSNAG